MRGIISALRQLLFHVVIPGDNGISASDGMKTAFTKPEAAFQRSRGRKPGHKKRKTNPRRKYPDFCFGGFEYGPSRARDRHRMAETHRGSESAAMQHE